jgi:hypothetical protein
MSEFEVEGKVVLARWTRRSASLSAKAQESVPAEADTHSTSDHHVCGCPTGIPERDIDRIRKPTSSIALQRRRPRKPLPPRTTHSDFLDIAFIHRGDSQTFIHSALNGLDFRFPICTFCKSNACDFLFQSKLLVSQKFKNGLRKTLGSGAS